MLVETKENVHWEGTEAFPGHIAASFPSYDLQERHIQPLESGVNAWRGAISTSTCVKHLESELASPSTESRLPVCLLRDDTAEE